MHPMWFVGLVGALLGVPAIGAKQPATAPPPGVDPSGPLLRSPATGPKDPYSKLFHVPEREALPLDTRARALRQTEQARAQLQAQLAQTVESSRPSVVCGMVVIPVDPTIDPKIVVGPPQGDLDHTMRVIQPPACR